MVAITEAELPCRPQDLCDYVLIAGIRGPLGRTADDHAHLFEEKAVRAAVQIWRYLLDKTGSREH